MALAMLFHGAWDAVAGISRYYPLGLFAVYLLVPIGLVVTFVWIYKRSVPTERRWMHDLLAPEVASGVLQQVELDALAGTR